MQILDDGDEDEIGDGSDPIEGRTDVICPVSCVFGSTRLGSGGRGSFGPFGFIARKILDWNWRGKCVLCRTLERRVSNK